MDKILVDFFIRHNRATILILLMIIISGIYAYIVIPKEQVPDVKIPIIMVGTSLSGISPEDSERLLLKPMENGLRSVENVQEMMSIATEGRAYLILKFDAGFDNKKALDDVRSKLDNIVIPRDAEKVTASEVNLSLFPVLNLVISGDLDNRSLLAIAREVKKSIEALPNVLKADIGGYRKDIIEVLIDPKILFTYNLDLNQVIQILTRNNQLIAAGNFAESGYSVKINGIIKNIDDIMNIPVQVNGDSVITIKDVAKVRQIFEDHVSYARVNGKQALVLEISKRTGKNIIETIDQVKYVVDQAKLYLPGSVSFIYSFDQSKDIIDMLNDLKNNIILAVLFVVIIMTIFMGIKTSTIVAITIPGSFLIGVLTVYYMGFTMNIVVLFSLILSIGMLVDASIIVNEYADRKMTVGLQPEEAYRMAATKVFWPVISSTLTTLVVFMPLLFWPGMAGQFMKYLPITLIATLSGSLLMSLIFTPVIGSMIGSQSTHDPDKIAKMHAVDQGDTQNLGPFMKQYYQLLTKVLSYPKSFVAIILSSLVLTIILYLLFGRGMEFFPDVEPKSSIISIRSQGNISLRQRDQIAREVEDKILNMNDEIAVFYTRAGIFRGAGNNTDDVIARIQLEYVDWKNRRKVKKIVNEIKDKLKNFPGLIIEIDNKKEGPPQGKPIQIEVSARDKILIDKTILRLEEIMNSIKEITNISNDKSTPEIEWNIEVDRNKAARYGADVNLIGSYIKLATNGVLLTKYRPDYTDEEVEILARFPEEFRNISQLKNVFINTSLGSVAISSFIKIVPQNKIKQINRVNAQRASTLFADVLPDVLPSDVIKKINTLIKKENFEPNIQIKFKGEQEDQEEAKNFLIKAFISALMFMILILLLQFNSYYQVFIIMTAVFLSTTGVFLGLMITQQAFVIVMCGVGIIALAGIVVNNNILLIDAYAEYILDGESKKQAIIKAAISRLRPILLTAGTTVLGLLPMITGINIDFLNVEITYNAPSNQWWRQLSTTIAGGLSFATILTLFFTPALLMIGRNKD